MIWRKIKLLWKKKRGSEDKNILFVMKSAYLFSCCKGESTIYNIKEDSYEIIQKIENINEDISKAIELHNEKIIILSKGFYVFKKDKDGNQYILDGKSVDENFYSDAIQLNEYLIVFVTQEGKMIKYFNEGIWRSPKIVVSYLKFSSFNNCLLKYDSDFLILGGNKKIYLINFGDYRVKQALDVEYEINSICRVNDIHF